MRHSLILTAIVMMSCFATQAQPKIPGIKTPTIKTPTVKTNRFDPPKRPGESVTQNADEDYEKYLQEKNWAISELFPSENDLTQYISNQNSGDHYVKEYEEKAKALNYKEVHATLQKKGKPSGNAAANWYDQLIKFEQKYKDYYNKSLSYYINKSIEDAYTQKSHNASEAANTIERSKKWMDAINFNMLDESVTASLTKDLAKAYADVVGKQMAATYTSDLHKKNVGKILFSKKPIVIGKEDPNQFTTDFGAKDNIYAVAYLKGSIAELVRATDAAGEYYLTVNGIPDYMPIRFGHNPEDVKNTYYQIEIIPQAGQAKHKVDAVKWAEKLSKLSPRNHKIKVDFGSPDRPGVILASGEFGFDWTNGDGAALVKNAESASDLASDGYDEKRPLPEIFKRTTQKFDDPALSQEKMKAMLQKEFGALSTGIMKVIVLGDGTAADWHIHKNDLDIPTHQETQPAIIAIFKSKDPKWCYYVENISFEKDYLGGGRYGPVKFFGAKKPVRLACANVK